MEFLKFDQFNFEILRHLEIACMVVHPCTIYITL